MQDPRPHLAGEQTAPRCSRRYDDGTNRAALCGGPMAPLRHAGTWGCAWCGKVEVAR